MITVRRLGLTCPMFDESDNHHVLPYKDDRGYQWQMCKCGKQWVL